MSKMKTTYTGTEWIKGTRHISSLYPPRGGNKKKKPASLVSPETPAAVLYFTANCFMRWRIRIFQPRIWIFQTFVSLPACCRHKQSLSANRNQELNCMARITWYQKNQVHWYSAANSTYISFQEHTSVFLNPFPFLLVTTARIKYNKWPSVTTKYVSSSSDFLKAAARNLCKRQQAATVISKR